MREVRVVAVTDSVIDVADVEASVASDTAGAVAVFRGVVRDNDHGRAVTSLTYEAHPTATEVITAVASEIAARFDVVALSVVHRVGAVPIGEDALVAAVSSVHRAEAFAACSALVGLTKERLPVWKHQVLADGSDEWVNCA